MKKEPVLQRLKRKILVDENGCWVWQANKDQKGYGLAFDGTTMRRAHIVFYLLIKGEYEPGLELDHTCRNRACVNPDHLDPVTHQENIRRGQTGIVNRSKTHCSKGHEFTPENTYKTALNQRQCKQCKRDIRTFYGKKNRDLLNAKNRERARLKRMAAQGDI